MTAPVLWILIPGVAGFVLFLLRRRSNLVIAGGVIVAGLLTVAAWLVPIDDPLQIGPLSLKIADTLLVLGRRFVLIDPDRPLLVLIYGATTLWFSAAYVAQPGDLFIPVGLGIVGFLTAALAVSPFLFAALFIEIAALLSVPLLAAPGQPIRAGVMRFLIYQTAGAPFILFTGWLLAGVEASPADIELVIRAALLLAIGFAFLLAVVPFHTWIVMLAEKVHPFRAGFIFVMMLGVVSLFGMGFLDRFAWLRNSDTLYLALSMVGFIMVAVGGLWASFQDHLGRVLGYAVVMEMGMAFMAVSLGEPEAVQLYFGLYPPRVIGLLLWSVALTVVRRTCQGLTLDKIAGLMQAMPLVVGGLLSGHLTLAGLPLLPGFPVRLALFAALAAENFWLAVGAVIGTSGLFVAVVRTVLAVRQPAAAKRSTPGRKPFQTVFFVVGLTALIVLGVFPGLLSPSIEALSRSFINLGR